MASLNKVMIIGNLGADPEVRALPSGDIVASLRVACNYGTGDQQHTEWVSVQAWEKQAEFAEQYLKKGSLVYVEGSLRTRSWEDNGATRYATEVRAFNIQGLSRNGTAAPAEEPVMPF